MKKNKLMKVSAILATALMAASAAGMSVTAGNVKTAEAVRSVKTTRSASRTTRRAKGGSSNTSIEQIEGSESISLQGQKAKPGDTIEIPLVMHTNNLCICYDLLVEFDARLEFVGVEGAQASCNFEEDGRKYVSLVGYGVEPFKDDTTIAKIKLRVPNGAENDDYDVRFSQITTFSAENSDFEDYTKNNAVITVTGGVEKKKGNMLELKNVVGMAGDGAVVQLVPNSNNRCVSFDMLVEYDSRLLLEDKDVAGANSFCIFEQDGKSYVSLVAYTTDIFADGKAAVALNFHLPYDATPSDTYEVKIVEVNDFSSGSGTLSDYTTDDAVISVVSSSRPNDKYSEYKVYKQYAANGALMGSAVALRGDVNGDDKADVRDAAATANYCANKRSGGNTVDEKGEFFGDVDESGDLNIRDAAKIARYVSKGKVSWDDVLGS
ncbi:MAG: cohesin domain-containing protein [Porcipelethomonas sp.]